MRRLPIFLVLDVSESMAGPALKDLENGMELLQKALMSDPMALETVYISVISFAGMARVVTPLTYILDFTPPKLSVGAGTNLSEALKCLMKEIDTNVKKSTPEVKGDWKPLIFILTDGTPNDNYQTTIQQWKSKYGKYSVVAVLMGEHSDATALKLLTENVIVFKNASSESFKSFFKWVSASVQTSSKELGTNGKTSIDDMERIRRNMEADLLANELPTENKMDYFVLVARCQKTKKPYIMRYIKTEDSYQYVLDGAYPVDEGYFEMSGHDVGKSLSGDMIDGMVAPCPYCGNSMLGHSECDKWICLNPEHMHDVKCPWCGKISSYGGSVDKLSGGRG